MNERLANSKPKSQPSDSGGSSMIEARNLTKIYKAPGSEIVVFENLNLEVTTGSSAGGDWSFGCWKEHLACTCSAVWIRRREVMCSSRSQNIFEWNPRSLRNFAISMSALSFSSIIFCRNSRRWKIR